MVPSRFLYLVRHGDADDDGALTQAGQQQAAAAAERLRHIRFSAIRHSPAERAEETAELIAENLPVDEIFDTNNTVPYLALCTVATKILL
jgi:probable phosphoglycerate mutase